MSTSNELSFIFTEKGFRVDEGDEIELSPAMKTWKERFEADRWQALYDLGFQEKGEGSPSFSFLYRLASSFDHVLLTSPLFPFLKGKLEVSLPEEEKKSLLSALPYVLGMEWVDGYWLSLAEGKLNEAFHRDFHHFDGTVEAYISSKKKGVSLPDRIYFHLVELSSDEISPFAFLATYATFDREGRVRQMPLYYALEEYKKDREKLIRLLSSLNKAADIMPRLSDFVEDGTILHPFGVTAEEAWHFLKAVPLLEEKGIYCRIPNWWKKGRSRPSISVSLGGSAAEPLGLDTILSLRPELSVDGVKLTMADVHRLMKETEGLSFIKGKWVEVDHDRLAKLLGLPVTALEDRPEFAEELRQAGADAVLCLPFAEGLAQISGGQETYFVVVTRAHSCDIACLRSILQKPAAYVGMMGSRKRAALVHTQLAELGLPQERIDALHAPIGLSIGAKTAQEIALSILAEIVSVKNSRQQTEGFSPALLAALEQQTVPAVLATIVGRHGSTPREEGSKMLVLPDGSAVGSVGGGIMEYRTQQMARELLEPGAAPCRIAAFTTEGASDAAAIAACGGSMEVFLQRLEPEG